MDATEKKFPCPICGSDRTGVKAVCEICGWRQDRDERDELALQDKTNRQRPCEQCGSTNHVWGGLYNSWFMPEHEEGLVRMGRGVRCRCCLDCGRLALYSNGW